MLHGHDALHHVEHVCFTVAALQFEAVVFPDKAVRRAAEFSAVVEAESDLMHLHAVLLLVPASGLSLCLLPILHSVVNWGALLGEVVGPEVCYVAQKLGDVTSLASARGLLNRGHDPVKVGSGR